jgi:hypothetical protein
MPKRTFRAGKIAAKGPSNAVYHKKTAEALALDFPIFSGQQLRDACADPNCDSPSEFELGQRAKVNMTPLENFR